MLGLSVIILFNLIFNVNSNLAESSANCSVTSRRGDGQQHLMIMQDKHTGGVLTNLHLMYLNLMHILNLNFNLMLILLMVPKIS